MKIKLSPGKYVAAVSGGVDSMVLLELAAKQKGVKLIVAHFDHGIHKNSDEYSKFVQKKAKALGLEFASEKGELGVGASEATARKARYEFLEKLKKHYKAKAILTAHHKDDVVETAIINLLRGSGRKGLASLKSTDKVKRPLLTYTKKQITDYANKHNVEWREDPTNLNTSYLRNYIRLKIVPNLNQQQKDRLLTMIDKQSQTNRELERLIANLMRGITDPGLDRKLFISLSHDLAKEVMAELFRSQKIGFDSKLLEKSVAFAKTAKYGKTMSISKNSYLKIDGDNVGLYLL